MARVFHQGIAPIPNPPVCVPMLCSAHTAFTKPHFWPLKMDASFSNTFNHITRHATIQFFTSLLVWLFNFLNPHLHKSTELDSHAEIEVE